MMRFKKEEMFVPRVKVIGVGGGGCNVLNSMLRSGELDGIEMVAVNTDLQHLNKSLAEEKLQIGHELSQGLGAGADPEIGRQAAIESLDEIRERIEEVDILFLIGGLGGGTGTGALPVIAQAAKDMGILTIAVVSKPFSFEGKTRMDKAEYGLSELRKHIDTIICIPNDRLFEIVGESTSLVDAFCVTDNILCEGVRAIASLMGKTGYINVDFADLRSIMKEKGRAILSFGEGSGRGKAVNAIEAALTSPFIEWHDLSGAKGIMVNFTGGRDLTLFEVNDAVKALKKISAPDANLIFGAVIDENLQDRTYVTLMITGLPNDMFGRVSPEGGIGAAEPEPLPERMAVEIERPAPPARAPETEADEEFIRPRSVAAQEGGRGRQAAQEAAAAEHARKLEQSVIDFTPEDRGIFEKISPTMYDGENLDIPPWIRNRDNAAFKVD